LTGKAYIVILIQATLEASSNCWEQQQKSEHKKRIENRKTLKSFE
jgi:hypothetical protein